MTTSILQDLKELLIDELHDLHDAENQLAKALPKLAEAASMAQLKRAFEEHLELTKNHVVRIERAFALLDTSPNSKTCHAMGGLLKESRRAIRIKGPDFVRDAKLCSTAQRVEHYEIAAYGTACSLAEKLQEQEVAALLQETHDEERAADRKFTELFDSVHSNEVPAGDGNGTGPRVDRSELV